jgi:hypothetical protein
MKRGWEHVAGVSIFVHVGMDPPMAVAPVNNLPFPFPFLDFAMSDQSSKKCHDVWMVRKVFNLGEAASKESPLESLNKRVGWIFCVKGIVSELRSSLRFCSPLEEIVR